MGKGQEQTISIARQLAYAMYVLNFSFLHFDKRLLAGEINLYHLVVFYPVYR
jgi:hypothetical protein